MALPCQTSSGWDYEECYSYYANGCYNTCQFVEFGDIEDFMNNEKRKEKSRDAARSRRSKETEVFTDLASALPISQEQVSQLDKASVMRLAIAYLRVRDMISLVPEPPEPDDHKILADESIFLKSLEGFLVVMSSEGDIVYMSENVSDYLGITQICSINNFRLFIALVILCKLMKRKIMRNLKVDYADVSSLLDNLFHILPI
ncbi:hypothetical protein BDFB_005757, partial [Asbolus verrucosus]